MLSILLLFETQAQEASVERSICGIQAGILGFFAYNEMKVSNTIALRSEAGFKTTNLTIGNPVYSRGNEPFVPLVLNVEPRWYYNIKQRHAKGLAIDNNSATFLSLMIIYHAGWLMISGKQPSNIEIIPTLAVRYNIGKCFDFEMGGGCGYQYAFTSAEEEKDYWAFNIVLRIGYVF